MIKFIQLLPCSLEAFLNSSDTSFDAAGFIYNDGVTIVDPADIGDVCYATIEPRTERAELISFTIDSVTSEGVATLTVVRGLSQSSPYGTGGATFEHQAGSNLVISNNPGLLNHFAAKDNDEEITGDWTAPTPATPTSIVNKDYADTKVDRTSDESIGGVKTFTEAIVIEDAVAPDEATSLGQVETYVEDLDDENVKLTGNQTIDGEKTFSTSPKVPDATAADEPYTKGQHDADAEASSAVASPTVRGSAKLNEAADDPLDPVVVAATTARLAALAGNGGTPDASNTYVTEEGLDLLETSINIASGSTTKDISTVTDTVIAHGLGVVPSFVSLKAAAPGTSRGGVSIGEWHTGGITTSSTSVQSEGGSSANNDYYNVSTVYILECVSGSDSDQLLQGTITVDDTNITISWAKTNLPTGTWNLIWVAKKDNVTYP
jgi:hypothetical protein